MTIRLAAATEDFGSDLKTAIAEAARCEVKGLRLNARTEVRADEFSETALRQLKHFVAERQMTVAGLMFPSRNSLHDPEHLDRRVQSIKAAMPLVRKLGTSELLIRCGRIPDPTIAPEESLRADSSGKNGPTNSDVDTLKNPFSFAPISPALRSAEPSEAQKFTLLCDILNDLVGYSSHVGCTLQLLISSYDTDRIRRLLNSIQSGPVKLAFDPATAVMTGRSPVRVFRDLYASVGYIRGRDAMADVDGAGVEVAFGDGKVDWTELLPTIAETEYDGWFCIERPGGEQRAEDVRLGFSRVRELLHPGL
jgi:sugar phosphate isomerase/epimerase